MNVPLVSPIFNVEIKKALVNALCSERFVLEESVKFEEII